MRCQSRKSWNRMFEAKNWNVPTRGREKRTEGILFSPPLSGGTHPDVEQWQADGNTRADIACCCVFTSACHRRWYHPRDGATLNICSEWKSRKFTLHWFYYGDLTLTVFYKNNPQNSFYLPLIYHMMLSVCICFAFDRRIIEQKRFMEGWIWTKSSALPSKPEQVFFLPSISFVS